MAPRHRLSQSDLALGRPISVGSVAHRLGRGVEDVRCDGEVRLTDAEVDDIPAFTGERLGSLENREGRFGSNLSGPGSRAHAGFAQLDSPMNA